MAEIGIVLADFSTYLLTSQIGRKAESNEIYSKLYNFLIEHQIDNYQQLVDSMEQNPELFPPGLKKSINNKKTKIESYIKIAIELGYANPKFDFPKQTCLTNEQRAVLNIINGTTMADALLCMTLLSTTFKTKKELSIHSISTLKKLLSHVTIDSYATLPNHRKKCCIVTGVHFLNLPYRKVKLERPIADAIRVHDDMIATQIINSKSPITSDDPQIIFSDLEKRKKRVADQLVKVVEYIVNNKTEFVWGEIPDYQLALYKSLSRPVEELGENEREMAKNLINYLAFYFPLDWIEKGLTTESELTFVRDGESVTETVIPISLLKKRIK